MSKMIRKIRTGLHTQQYCDIIEGVFGQLSDGMWENSRAAEGYWPFIDAELENGEVILNVITAYYKGGWEARNRFVGMSDQDVKNWIAKKIKQVIKEEGLSWKRDNTESTDYLDTSWRDSKKESTVADCYYVYEMLLGRNVSKHPEYADKMTIGDSLKTLDKANIKYSPIEDEPWDSDVDESMEDSIGSLLVERKLRSEMTQEELADARAMAKKRREARKLAAAEKRGYEKAMRDHLGADYKPAPEAKEPEAKEPEANPDKSKEVPKYSLGSWEDYRENRNDPNFLKYLDRAKNINSYLADKFEDVVFDAWRKNVPISNIRKILNDCYASDLSSDDRKEYGY